MLELLPVAAAIFLMKSERLSPPLMVMVRVEPSFILIAKEMVDVSPSAIM